MLKYTFPLILITIFLCFGCNTVSEEVIGAGSIDPPDTTGFYSTSAAGVTLKYKVDNTDLHCIISSSSTGWVAVGFNPGSMMQNANYIIGYAQGNNAFIRDEWGTGTTTHEPDIDLGGTDNVALISGSEIAGETRIEFKIPLDSGDQYDQHLAINETYPIILARGGSDDFTSYHTEADYSTITLTEDDGGNGDSVNYIMPDTSAYLSLIASDIIFLLVSRTGFIEMCT